MIFAYNKEQVGDVLMVILQDTKDIKRQVERKGKSSPCFCRGKRQNPCLEYL